MVAMATNNLEEAILKGKVISEGKPVAGATIYIKNTTIGSSADIDGNYQFTVPTGNLIVVVSAIGYRSKEVEIYIQNNESLALNFELEEDLMGLDQIVITGTRTFKKQTNTPVIVNVIDSKLLSNVQACSLSEGLRFQTGLRVETDCQTCNYTQLRMNGLAGGYSQILVNGRPIFSPLTGLYGLEQLPANMIDRIEVVRGGGSALYGSSAVGGTVNVITKIPTENSYNVGYTFQSIDGDTPESVLNGNVSLINKKLNAGISLFVNKRDREYYDKNNDNFSELPELKNNSFGANLFLLPTENQKIELSLSSLNEYRYGGEMVDKPAYLTQQSEERNSNVILGSLDYQINFNNDNSSVITYLSGQKTERSHYTGVFPDSEEEIQEHLENPPYGTSDVETYQGGFQINHRLLNFLNGSNAFTFGSEYIVDSVFDEIPAYNYLVDQRTTNFGMFLQSDWEINEAFNLLMGVRADKHNLVSHVIFSPRVSLLYKLKERSQFRFTWGTGFRAPQAFDADLHIAFAGGGVSRVVLSDDLKEEKSNSLSASYNFDKASEKIIYGFTFEGFYTYLKDAFYQHPIGEDEFGEVYEKRNGDGATVQGLTFEVRANYNKKVQVEAGLTYQSSNYDEPVYYSDALEPKENFLRTPNLYGYATMSFTPNSNFNTSVNLVYTGKMDVLHLAGAPEQTVDAFVTSKPFTELNFKTGYTFEIDQLDSFVEVFGGVKNVFDQYQNDFDTGKDRDSNYIYGPAAPRTFFIGLEIGGL